MAQGLLSPRAATTHPAGLSWALAGTTGQVHACQSCSQGRWWDWGGLLGFSPNEHGSHMGQAGLAPCWDGTAARLVLCSGLTLRAGGDPGVPLPGNSCHLTAPVCVLLPELPQGWQRLCQAPCSTKGSGAFGSTQDRSPWSLLALPCTLQLPQEGLEGSAALSSQVWVGSPSPARTDRQTEPARARLLTPQGPQPRSGPARSPGYRGSQAPGAAPVLTAVRSPGRVGRAGQSRRSWSAARAGEPSPAHRAAAGPGRPQERGSAGRHGASGALAGVRSRGGGVTARAPLRAPARDTGHRHGHGLASHVYWAGRVTAAPGARCRRHSRNFHSWRHMGQCCCTCCEFSHLRMQCMWKQCEHCPHTNGQSSPGTLPAARTHRQPRPARRAAPGAGAALTVGAAAVEGHPADAAVLVVGHPQPGRDSVPAPHAHPHVPLLIPVPVPPEAPPAPQSFARPPRRAAAPPLPLPARAQRGRKCGRERCRHHGRQDGHVPGRHH